MSTQSLPGSHLWASHVLAPWPWSGTTDFGAAPGSRLVTIDQGLGYLTGPECGQDPSSLLLECPRKIR
ncbi:hypothetical protein ACRRTK_014158 [Alexandromys fortis]